MIDFGLEWRNIKLVHYSKEYFEFIYNCYQDFNSAYLFCNNLEIKSKNEFWDTFTTKMTNSYNEYMIIISKENNEPIGFIYSFNYNTVNQTIYTAIYIIEKYRKSSIGAISGMIFYQYVFKTKPIRKIYCTVYEYNKDSLKLLKTAGFKQEGLLKKHRFLAGSYHDMYLMSLSREELYKVWGRIK